MKKAVKDLQPGDILPESHKQPRRVVLYTEIVKGVCERHIVYAVLGQQSEPVRLPPTVLPDESLIDIEPRVTPDELEQLLEIARAYVAGMPPSVTARKQAQDLINKLSPPNPPTYEELLDLVRRMCEPPRAYAEGQATPFSDCAKLAERARQAGLLK